MRSSQSTDRSGGEKRAPTKPNESEPHLKLEGEIGGIRFTCSQAERNLDIRLSSVPISQVI